jgi:hypothetical protein
MRLDFAVCFSILLAVIFIGAVGAFLLYVPPLGILTAVTIVVGLGLMFALGLMTGSRWRKLFSHRAIQIKRLPGNLSIVR